MEEKIITCGMCGRNFYEIHQLLNADGMPYYSLYTVEAMPYNMQMETIEQFIEEHDTDGGSIAGTWEDVMEELMDLFRREMEE